MSGGRVGFASAQRDCAAQARSTRGRHDRPGRPIDGTRVSTNNNGLVRRTCLLMEIEWGVPCALAARSIGICPIDAIQEFDA